MTHNDTPDPLSLTDEEFAQHQAAETARRRAE
jgi:hypothetical protein